MPIGNTTLPNLATRNRTISISSAGLIVSGSVIISGSANTITLSGASTTESPATQTYVTGQIGNLVDSAPTALDTLNELAAAIGDDANYASTISTALGNRLRVDTASQGLDSTQQSNARTNLGLGTAATSAASAFQSALTNPVTGTGTTNYLTKFTGTSTVGSSQIYDTGTIVTVGGLTNTGNILFQVNGTARVAGVLYLGSTINNGTYTYTLPNATGTLALTSSTVTIGSTAITLGSSATTIAGLSSVTSTTFVGALTGNASTATSAGNADTLDSYHETAFIRLAPNSSTATNGTFAIGSASSRNFIQSHSGQPLDINPLGNSVHIKGFFDYDDSNYYADPAGTSNLYGLTVNQTITGNISGNAATATTADQIDGQPFRNTTSNSAINANELESNGITYYTSGVINFSGNATDGALYSQAYSSAWQHQIAGDYRSGQIAVRGKNSGTWQSWRSILDSTNFSTWAATAAQGTKADTAHGWGNHASAGYLTSFNITTQTDPKYIRSDADDVFTGNLTTGADNHITFGPNTTWGSSLRIGGNGRTATGTEMASIVTTDGNIHLDAANSNNGIYLNYYAGTAGVGFGSGASGIVAWMGSDGDLWKGSSDNSGDKYWHAGNDGAGSGLDADTLDGYHASALWRSNGGAWNPGANITLGQTANGQEWSFDITRNGYTGGYWHVWDSSNSTMLKVDAVSGKVSAPYNFVGNLEGNAATATSAGNADTLDGEHGTYYDHRRYTDSTNYLGGYYVSGGSEKPNNTIFGSAKLKLAMLAGTNLGYGGTWNDVLWLSGYQGGDVKQSYAIVGDKYGDNLWFSRQAFDSGTWGTGRRLWHSGDFSSTNISNWNTAYGWGNHASAGYLTSFSETDTLDSVTDRGASTTNNISIGALTTSGKITLGTFANSTTNSGEAWLGRASDRSAGTFTVQLGSGTGRKFEVVDYAWTRVEFSADDSGVATARGSFRAPIFYDSNDTNYYLDPHSSGISLNVRGEIQNPSIWINDGDNNNNYNENIRLFNATNGVSVIAFGSSGTGGIPQSSLLGFSDRLEIRVGANGTAVQRNYDNYVEAIGSFRAPIFYDSNDTNYYVDPNGTTNLNSVYGNEIYANNWFRNVGSNEGLYNESTTQHWSSNTNGYWDVSSTTNASSGVVGIRLYAGGHVNTLRGYFFSDANGVGILNNQGGWSVRSYQGSGYGGELVGNWTVTGDVYAPGFIDSGNTNYYLDPASTSILGNVRTNNHSTVAGDGYGYGFWQGYGGSDYSIWMSTSGNGTYGGQVSGVGSGNDYNMYFRMNYNNRGFVFITGDNTPKVQIANEGILVAGGIDASNRIQTTAAVGGTYFYDVADSTYYFDGAETGDSIRVAGDIVAYYSDDRLKTRLGNIENAVDKVKTLNGFYYEPNETAQKLGYKKKVEIGVSAQEVEQIMPELIKQAPIDMQYKTIDYARLTPLLIEAVKEQQQQIDELKRQINLILNK
jgi:hypothetical protein